MALLRMCKKQLTKDFIFMAVGAAFGAIIGILIGNSVLAFFLAGFFGTLKNAIGRFWADFKDTSEGESKIGKAITSLLLAVLIAPVWFVFKLIKRIKAFFQVHSIEKKLAKKIVPSAFADVVYIWVSYFYNCGRVVAYATSRAGYENLNTNQIP
ncbi:MAG: hypothetical protein LBL28_09655 [Treponema sp.]|jgi:ABC-type multidrug transport system fused ATPase/permease subunit|nr:hypothetical protein [Treponema sp.]